MRDGRLLHLVLASSSSGRHRLLSGACIAHRVVPSRVDERFEHLTTSSAVALLAERKARQVERRLPREIVLGCDSLLEFEGRPYGKPKSRAQAAALWERLAGREATLWTGHFLIDGRTGRTAERSVGTTVRFDRPSPGELEAYLQSGEAELLAGGFSIEGRAAPFLAGIDGEPANVIGLSLSLLRQLLRELGFELEQFDWTKRSFEVRPLDAASDRDWYSELVETEWGLPLVSTSGSHDPRDLPGYVAESAGSPLGVLAYRVDGEGLEVVLLQSLVERAGVGGRLLEAAAALAGQLHKRLWLTTTDENLRAIGFYLSHGMRLVRLHHDFVVVAGTAKPRLLEEGVFRDALEFELSGP